MKYVSTRGLAPELDFEDVLLTGLAKDGGLYVPASWPRFDPDEISELTGRPYQDVAAKVLWPFVGASIPPADLKEMEGRDDCSVHSCEGDPETEA